MHLKSLLSDLAEELELNDKDMGRILNFDPRTVEKIRLDEENWRLSRIQLETLWRFAVEHGYTDGPFELRPHPVWASFRDTPTTIFRSSRIADSKVEHDLQAFLSQLHSTCKVYTDEEDVDLIYESLQQRNTIFVGSPRTNPASEIALASLLGVEAFKPGVKCADGPPIRFLGMESDNEGRESSFLFSGASPAIELVPGDGQKPVRIEVLRMPLEAYRQYRGEGIDAGVMVVCPQPLKTQRRVSSIVIAGYSGLATQVLAHELTHGEPAIYSADLQEVGVPRFALLGFRFHKRATPSSKRNSELRRVLETTKVWGPPWPKIRKASKDRFVKT